MVSLKERSAGMNLYKTRLDNTEGFLFETVLGDFFLSYGRMEKFSMKENFEMPEDLSFRQCDSSTENITNSPYMAKLVLMMAGFKHPMFYLEFGSTPSTLLPRDQFNELLSCLMPEEPASMTLLYGVRRTGKTTLMKQACSALTEAGVPEGKVAYLCLTRNGLDGDELYSYTKALFDHGVDYLFLDELTYAEGDLSFTSFYEHEKDKKIVMAGTDSAGFIPLLQGALYDGVNVIHTTYISYGEYSRLFPGTTLTDYIRDGGLLIDAKKPYLTWEEQ